MIERVAASTLEENADQFLRPDVIVLIIKGSVGKVGIVPTDVPESDPGGWVAGQSAIVLRANADHSEFHGYVFAPLCDEKI